MVRYIIIIIIILIGVLAITNARAQKIDAFAIAKVSAQQVVVEQPIKVSVKAYSSTWFAEPLSFSNLQVEGAYVQAFKSTQGSIEYIKGKKYAALEFHYILFPYVSGEITFPVLELTTSIPPENDYKGQNVTLKTKAITITVDPPPTNADAQHWLVATNASISNQWSLNLNELKVGDVISRKITMKANGTLPTFIDEPLIGSIDFASVYTSEPEFIDERDNHSANGRRIDMYSYLLEKTGEFTVPEVEVKWWNPYIGQFYKRTLPAYIFKVGPNESMAELQALKDSLNAMQPIANLNQETITEEAKTPYLHYLLGSLIAFIIIYISYKILSKVIKGIQQQRITYRNSEAFLFKKILTQKSTESLIAALYQWTSRLKLHSDNRTLRAISSDNELLRQSLIDLNQSVYSSKTTNKKQNTALIKKQLKQNRKKTLKQKQSLKHKQEILHELNP